MANKIGSKIRTPGCEDPNSEQSWQSCVWRHYQPIPQSIHPILIVLEFIYLIRAKYINHFKAFSESGECLSFKEFKSFMTALLDFLRTIANLLLLAKFCFRSSYFCNNSAILSCLLTSYSQLYSCSSFRYSSLVAFASSITLLRLASSSFFFFSWVLKKTFSSTIFCSS